MGRTIPVDRLAAEVMDGLTEYAGLAADVLKKEIQEAGKTAKKQIEQTARAKQDGTQKAGW